MKGTKKELCKKVAQTSLRVAVMAAGTASIWGGCQPKEPKLQARKKEGK